MEKKQTNILYTPVPLLSTVLRNKWYLNLKTCVSIGHKFEAAQTLATMWMQEISQLPKKYDQGGHIAEHYTADTNHNFKTICHLELYEKQSQSN